MTELEWKPVGEDGNREMCRFNADPKGLFEMISLKVHRSTGGWYWEVQKGGCVTGGTVPHKTVEEAKQMAIAVWRNWARSVAETAGWCVSSDFGDESLEAADGEK